jgi:hypothetical protein
VSVEISAAVAILAENRNDRNDASYLRLARELRAVSLLSTKH